MGVFLLKMCKISDFFPFYTLIHIYASIDVDALTAIIEDGAQAFNNKTSRKRRKKMNNNQHTSS